MLTQGQILEKSLVHKYFKYFTILTFLRNLTGHTPSTNTNSCHTGWAQFNIFSSNKKGQGNSNNKCMIIDLFITNITEFNPFLSVHHYSLNFVIRYSFSAAQSIIELYSTKLQSFTVSTESHSTYRITQCRQNYIAHSYIAQSCRITQQKGTGCRIIQYRVQSTV